MEPELRDRLVSLHQALSTTQSPDPQARELLGVLQNDITRLLDATPGASLDDHRSLAERLDASAVNFEAEHPALGAALRQVVDILAKAGI